jgi:hypothetical protein
MHNSGGNVNGDTGGGNGGGSFPQKPAWFGGSGAGAQQPTRPPTPYKHWENWNYCHSHGGDIDDTHTSALCGNRGPTHNPNATHANIMGRFIAGMHKTILPSSMRPYSSLHPSPPAAAMPTAMPNSVISGKCLRRIAPAVAMAMVDGFVETTLNTNQTQLLPSNNGTFLSLVVCENFNPKTDPLLSSSMRQASFKCETPRLELKSSQSFLAIKRCQGTKSKIIIKLAQISLNKWRICAPIGVFLLRAWTSK